MSNGIIAQISVLGYKVLVGCVKKKKTVKKILVGLSLRIVNFP